MAYYRNVFHVTVLSDHPLEGAPDDLAYLAHEIEEGDLSGEVDHVDVDRQLDAREMADALVAQGTDPAFLLSDDDQAVLGLGEDY